MDNADIKHAIEMQVALQFVNALTEDQKRSIIVEGVSKQLANLQVSYNVREILEDTALKMAKEYVKLPEVREKIRHKAHEAVDLAIEVLIGSFLKELDSTVRSQYRALIKEK